METINFLLLPSSYFFFLCEIDESTDDNWIIHGGDA